MPRGFLEPKESTLEENDKLLPPGMCRELTSWWLAKPPKGDQAHLGHSEYRYDWWAQGHNPGRGQSS